MSTHSRPYSKPPAAVAAHQGVRAAKYLGTALLLDTTAQILSPAEIIERLHGGTETRASVAAKFSEFGPDKQMELARGLRDDERCSNELLLSIADTIREQTNGSKPAPRALAFLSVEARAEEIALRAATAESVPKVRDFMARLPAEYAQPPLSLVLAAAFREAIILCEDDSPRQNQLELIAKRLEGTVPNQS